MQIDLTTEFIGIVIVVLGIFGKMYLDHFKLAELKILTGLAVTRIADLERKEISFSKDLQLSYVSLSYLQEKYLDSVAINGELEHIEKIFASEMKHITDKLDEIFAFIKKGDD